MVAACAYCRTFIAHREPLDDPVVTHGACDPCMARVLREWATLTGMPLPDLGALAGASAEHDDSLNGRARAVDGRGPAARAGELDEQGGHPVATEPGPCAPTRA